MAFFKKNEEQLPALTEPSRHAYFKDSDQNEWTRLYKLLTDEIVKMLDANKTLFEIYEYARSERGNIAKKLNHRDQADFGVVRDFRGNDLYNKDTFANTPNYDPYLFDYLVAAVPNEGFTDKSWGGRDIMGYYHRRNPDEGTTYQLRTNQKKESLDEMYLEIVVEQCPDEDEQIIEVKVNWREMNQEIYKNRIGNIGKGLLIHVKNCEKGSKEALYSLGLLAHALCRDIYVKRGAAAINGGILRAVARTKGFDFGLMTMNGLPFDVYAEMTLDPDLYAKNFVLEVGRAYKLFINPQIESKLELSRNKIQEIITKFKKNELPGQPSNWLSKWFSSNPDYNKELDELSSDVDRSRNGYAASLDRCDLLVNLLTPYVDKTPKTGDILQKALLPIYSELKEVMLLASKQSLQPKIS